MTAEPPRVTPCTTPATDSAGTMARRPFEPAPADTSKPRTPDAQVKLAKVEALRPSIQVSNCFAEITDTPRACAAPTIVVARVSEVEAPSVWMFAVKAP